MEKVQRDLLMIIIISAMLLLRAAQVAPAADSSCLIDSKFSAKIKGLQADIAYDRLYLRGCSYPGQFYAFNREITEAEDQFDYPITFTSIFTPKMCNENDGDVYPRRFQSVAMHRIVNKGATSQLEMRDEFDNLLIVLIFKPNQQGGRINSRTLFGRYTIQLPTVVLSFSQAGKIGIEGCDQSPASYQISENGAVKFTDTFGRYGCRNEYQDLVADIIDKFSEFNLTDKASCSFIMTRTREDQLEYYKLEAEKIGYMQQRHSLIGNYSFTTLHSDMPAFKVTILGDTESVIDVRFEGCLTSELQYKKVSRVTLNRFSVNISKLPSYAERSCEPNYDQAIIDEFINVTIVDFNSNTQQLKFNHSQKQAIFIGESIPTSKQSSLIGKYFMAQEQSAQFLIQSDSNYFMSLKFKRCNTIDFKFVKNNPNSMSFVFRNGIKQQQSCIPDYDPQYVQLFQSLVSVTLDSQKNKLSLEKSNGDIVTANRQQLTGNYTITSSDSGLNAVKVQLLESTVRSMKLVFEGCNEHQLFFNKTWTSSPYQDRLQFTNLSSSLTKQCQIDNDLPYLTKFRSSVILQFHPETKQLQFIDSQQGVVCTGLTYKEPVQIPSESSLVGKYGFNFQRFVRYAIMEDNDQFLILQLFGCNTLNLTYSKISQIRLSLSQIAQPKTKQVCQYNNDDANLQLFKPIYLFNRVSEKKQLRFVTLTGGVYITFDQPMFISLIGDYNLYMIDDQAPLKVSIGPGTLRYKGCNEISYAFSITEKLEIKFEYLRGTNRFCQSDIDNWFADKLGSVVRFEFNQITQEFRLFDADSQIVYSTVEKDFH